MPACHQTPITIPYDRSLRPGAFFPTCVVSSMAALLMCTGVNLQCNTIRSLTPRHSLQRPPTWCLTTMVSQTAMARLTSGWLTTTPATSPSRCLVWVTIIHPAAYCSNWVQGLTSVAHACRFTCPLLGPTPCGFMWATGKAKVRCWACAACRICEFGPGQDRPSDRLVFPSQTGMMPLTQNNVNSVASFVQYGLSADNLNMTVTGKPRGMHTCPIPRRRFLSQTGMDHL